MNSLIPILFGNTQPFVCHPSVHLKKDGALSSADITRHLASSTLRAECAAIVKLRRDRIDALDIPENTMMVNHIVPPMGMGNFEGLGDGRDFNAAVGSTWEVHLLSPGP
jgi:hypothetical protein